MLLRRQVTLRVIVTEQFKEERIRELGDAIEEVEQTKSQIDFRSRIYLTELQRVDLNQAAEFRRRMEAEKRRQDEMKEQLSAELDEVRAAELGSEYTRGAIEGIAEVQVGDNIQGKLGHAELIVKDDVVVEIRERLPEPALEEAPAGEAAPAEE